ncbi:magnesium chelatase, partial [Candidatus Falkowbacteria bacterium RIFOXYA2_FULL_35_8]
ATIFAKNSGFKKIYIPAQNCHEATLVEGIDIYPIKNMSKLVGHLQKEKIIEPIDRKLLNNQFNITTQFEVDMSFVKGQEQAKRALEIAAAGGHNIIMSGPPGSGKTLLARTLPSIMPELTNEEILEVTKIYSVAGLLATETPIINTRPFRSPHHTSSGVALVGGGKYPKPGEITLAHRGILFLDEFPEFPRQVLENLRQPLEDGVISISRAQGTLTFPARFILVASQNPCPCGYSSDQEKNCTCTPSQIIKYQKKISGPILDRIDLHIEVPRLKMEKLTADEEEECSADIRQRVLQARERQAKRFKGTKILTNSEMRPQEIKSFCPLDENSMQLLKSATQKLNLSARSFHRIIKMSRTIADLNQEENIGSHHVAEAIQYRQKDS